MKCVHEAGIAVRKIKHQKLSESFFASRRLIINKRGKRKTQQSESDDVMGNVNTISIESKTNYATVIKLSEKFAHSTQIL